MRVSNFFVPILILLPILAVYAHINYYDVEVTTEDFEESFSITPSKTYEKLIMSRVPKMTFFDITISKLTPNVIASVYLMSETAYDAYSSGNSLVGRYYDDIIETNDSSFSYRFSFEISVDFYVVVALISQETIADFSINIVTDFDTYYSRNAVGLFVYITMYAGIIVFIRSRYDSFVVHKARKSYQKKIDKEEDEFYDGLLGKLEDKN
ncbi:MAG: hypothetical protein INQ03_25475 [Candidatus Heimdallarchaeota archaeon]|nr:hypothetical protein [Candidatus Heimdallarchaeota archaeon]